MHDTPHKRGFNGQDFQVRHPDWEQMTDIVQIPPHGVKLYAEDMKPLIERMMRKHPDGQFTFYGVLEKFMRGEWSCLARFDDEGKMYCLGATATYPDMKGRMTLQVVFVVGGTLDEMRNMYRLIETIAKEHGIEVIEFFGREGWKPMMRELGFNMSTRMYRKEL